MHPTAFPAHVGEARALHRDALTRAKAIPLGVVILPSPPLYRRTYQGVRQVREINRAAACAVGALHHVGDPA